LSTACLAAGGTLGILIPPSVVLVIYAILTEQNIAKLFLAAFVPGILAAIGYMIVIAIYVRVKPDSAGKMEPVPMKERWKLTARLRDGNLIGGVLMHQRKAPKFVVWEAHSRWVWWKFYRGD
jgi:TRAP-type C4-dicarboxylate transport system permease large subunit